MRRRVVITGMGVITPLGHSVAELFASQVAGRTAVGPITHFDARTFPTTLRLRGEGVRPREVPAGRVAVPQLRREHPLRARGRHARRSPTPTCSTASGDRSRMGVYLGSGEGKEDFEILTSSTARATTPGERTANIAQAVGLLYQRLNGPQEAEQEMYGPSGYLADHFALDGPFASCQTACAASSQAIGEATEMIRTGDADVMLAGGSHSMIHPFGVTGFNRLTALSQRNDSPTDREPPVRPHPRRLRHRRGRGPDRAGRTRTREGARREHLAELTGYGTHGRRVPHDRPAPGRPRRDPLHGRRARGRRAEPDRHRLHQRPRHQHAGERLGRDGRD